MAARRARRIPLPLACAVLALALAATVGHVLPRAAFKPDDYRYLWQLREADQRGPAALADAMVVENRWDGSWWIEEGAFVRFFRPLVILSFALDRAVFGEDARGFLLSNALWHLLASLLVFLCLSRIVAPGRPEAARPAALFGAVLFAVQAARFEHVAYVAARTDTFAGLAVAGTLAFFLARRERDGAGLTAGVSALFLASLLAKEYAVLLPLVLPLADRWLARSGDERPPWRALLRRRAPLFAALGATLLAYLALRAWALGEAGAGARPYPYFHLPGRTGFAEHAAAVGMQYAVSLVVGRSGPAFLTGWSELVSTAGPASIAAAGAGAAALLGWGLWRGGPARFCAAGFLFLLLPLLPLYSTARYLYVPGLFWCGLVARAAVELGRRPRWGRAAAVLWIAAALASQGWMLRREVGALPPRSRGSSEADALVALVARSELDPAGPPVFLIDSPLHWLHAQFLPHVLAVELDVELPRIALLSKVAPGAPSPPTRVTRLGPRALELSRPSSLVPPHPWGDFDVRRAARGERIERDGFTVRVLALQSGEPVRVRVDFERPLEELQVLRLEASPEGPRFARLASGG